VRPPPVVLPPSTTRAPLTAQHAGPSRAVTSAAMGSHRIVARSSLNPSLTTSPPVRPPHTTSPGRVRRSPPRARPCTPSTAAAPRRRLGAKRRGPTPRGGGRRPSWLCPRARAWWGPPCVLAPCGVGVWVKGLRGRDPFLSLLFPPKIQACEPGTVHELQTQKPPPLSHPSITLETSTHQPIAAEQVANTNLHRGNTTTLAAPRRTHSHSHETLPTIDTRTSYQHSLPPWKPPPPPIRPRGGAEPPLAAAATTPHTPRQRQRPHQQRRGRLPAPKQPRLGGRRWLASPSSSPPCSCWRPTRGASPPSPPEQRRGRLRRRPRVKHRSSARGPPRRRASGRAEQVEVSRPI
jgi:hypothetical protein